MAVLLRLLLCLSLLANTAGGAWAQPSQHTAAPPAGIAAAPCHEQAGDTVAGLSMSRHAAHADHGALPAPRHGGGDHCADHGCNCLQHCAYTLALRGLVPDWPSRALAALPAPVGGQDLSRPYPPLRPPIV